MRAGLCPPIYAATDHCCDGLRYFMGWKIPHYRVTGNQLNNSALNITTNGAPPETIYVFGTTQMDFSLAYGDTATVNLAAQSKWVGGFHESPGDLVKVMGAGSFANISSRVNGTAIIGTPVVGTGKFDDEESHSSGKLEFMHSVSAGQTVTVSGYELYGGQFGVLQVDDPASFHATNILGFGEIILEGMRATSYTFDSLPGSMYPSVLSLYNGKDLIYTTHTSVQTVNGSAPVNFGVSQTAAGVVIHADGTSYHDGGVLLGHA
jgi:hypothetical protein